MKPFEAMLEGVDGTTFHVQGWEPDDEHPKALVARYPEIPHFLYCHSRGFGILRPC